AIPLMLRWIDVQNREAEAFERHLVLRRNEGRASLGGERSPVVAAPLHVVVLRVRPESRVGRLGMPVDGRLLTEPVELVVGDSASPRAGEEVDVVECHGGHAASPSKMARSPATTSAEVNACTSR